VPAQHLNPVLKHVAARDMQPRRRADLRGQLEGCACRRGVREHGRAQRQTLGPRTWKHRHDRLVGRLMKLEERPRQTAGADEEELAAQAERVAGNAMTARRELAPLGAPHGARIRPVVCVLCVSRHWLRLLPAAAGGRP
jgi:hypothetical protein